MGRLREVFRQILDGSGPSEGTAFKDYFLLLQGELNRIEASGHLRGDANKAWLTFRIMYMQMGPVFLSEQIEAIIGMPSHSPEAVRERGRENARILKYGILANPEPAA